jgi:hypothetical protein
MKFDEILHRLTGISSPIFGVSWTPPEAEIQIAKRIIVFLEDRRVLYNPAEVEMPDRCVESVLKIREFLTHEMGNLSTNSELSQNLKAMRIACRKFLDNIDYRDYDFKDYRFSTNTFQGWIFISAIGELRSTFGIHIAMIAAKYGLEVEDNLPSILPGK